MSRNFWNSWHGCMKCSPGCLNCYMYALDDMRGVSEWSSVVKRTKEFDNVELFERKFNKFSCLICSQVEICNGCSNCGKCRNTDLIGLNELYKLRNGGN